MTETTRPSRRPRAPALAGTLGLAMAVLVLAGPAPAQTVASGFQETVVLSGLSQPTAIAFSPDGRVFVGEKSGVIKIFPGLDTPTPSVFADLRASVHNFWDRGLLGLALHPGFPGTPYVYVLYTHDAPVGGTAPRWGTVSGASDPCPNPPGATSDGCVVSGRLSRLEAAGSVATGVERVLVEDWCQQYPSHSVGSLVFGGDGALYASGGEGASFTFVDYGQDGNPLNPCGDPPGGVGAALTPPSAEGGALRSQSLRRPAGPVVLGGTVIRIDPDTGEGLLDNPLAASPDANARRIVAYGLRNPFRLAARPGTAEIWLGDVGWTTWEEVNRIAAPTAGVLNFGWPCYEGAARQDGYDTASLASCQALYGSGSHVGPVFAYHHASPVVPGEPCPTGSSSMSGLAFYPGGSYPATYTGALFVADYSRRCIWVVFSRDGQPDPTTVMTLVANAAAPVALGIGPGGDLFYVDFNGGTVRRIQYIGANQPPTAVARATPASGQAPLWVTLDGTASSDPDGGIVAYEWDVDGDGQFDDALGALVSVSFARSGTYTVRLRVRDTLGAIGVASVVVSASNTPPSPTILTPAPSLAWRVGDSIAFSGVASDAQDGPRPPSALTWSIVLHHCQTLLSCHAHPVQDFEGVAAGAFPAPDHSYPSHLEIRLTAVDSLGVPATVSTFLYPATATVTLASSPPGLPLTLDGTTQVTPFTTTIIVGSTHTIGAPSPHTVGASRYVWNAWSDGGARTHAVTAGAGAATHTATYIGVSADLQLVQTGIATGRDVTFVATVTNLGPADAQDLVVTDTLSGKLRFVSASSGCSHQPVTRLVSCGRPSLAPGASWTVSITARASRTGGSLDNTVRVATSTLDLNAANDAATVRVRLSVSGIQIAPLTTTIRPFVLIGPTPGFVSPALGSTRPSRPLRPAGRVGAPGAGGRWVPPGPSPRG